MARRASTATGSAPLVVRTIGHSTRTVEELVEALRAEGVTTLVDVRTIPRSRTNPQFNADALPSALAPHGIAYRALPALGGLRGRRKDAAAPPPDENGAWRNASFHRYADYALTEAFRAGLDELVALARASPTAIMCAEILFWRCHRRIIADHLLARGIAVRHVRDAAHVEEATLTPFARVEADGRVRYPASG